MKKINFAKGLFLLTLLMILAFPMSSQAQSKVGVLFGASQYDFLFSNRDDTYRKFGTGKHWTTVYGLRACLGI